MTKQIRKRTKPLNRLQASFQMKLARAFKRSGGEAWLLKQMVDNPVAMLNVLAKACIPNQLNVETTLTVDIGRAMIEAGERLKLSRSVGIIDVTPDEVGIDEKPGLQSQVVNQPVIDVGNGKVTHRGKKL